MEHIEEKLQQLIDGEIDNLYVKKEDFANVREVLVKHEKFKHFRGEAKQGGDIVYTYLQQPRA